MRSVGRISVALALALALTAGYPRWVDAAHGQDEPLPTRILFYGDSYLMGFSGDWTVRYRIWQLLTSAGTTFDFVGPRDDVRSLMGGWYGSQGYRYSDFDRDHAAVAGMTFTAPVWELSTVAVENQADVVVAMVGTADLTRSLATPEQLAQEWREQIAQARETSPETDFVLVPYPITWFAPVAAYNEHLTAIALELDTPESRVILAPLAPFEMVRHTYDRIHPSAAGERLVALAIADALATLEVGPPPSTLGAIPNPRTARWAPAVKVSAAGTSLEISWPRVEYASAMDVVVEDVTSETSADWSLIAVKRVRDQYWSLPAPSGRYRVWLRPVKGYLQMGTQSPKVTIEMPATP